MSRRRRHTESGEVALMAVVTKAMGAFLILMIFGFKYYVEDTVGKAEVQNARQQIEDAKSQLAAMADKAKNADAANAQMAEMKKQLDAAMKPLNAAEDAMGELKARLDQASSQINKLKQEKAFVENELAQARAQVDPLKNEVARLSKQNDDLNDQLKKAEADRQKLADDMNARLAQSQQQLKDLADQKKTVDGKLDTANKERTALNNNLTFTVSADNCRGMDLSVYVRSEWPDRAMPAVDRTNQPISQYYTTSDTFSVIDGPSRLLQAVFTDVTPGQKFTLYGKYLNAVPGNGWDARTCALSYQITRTRLPGSTMPAGTVIHGTTTLTEDNPYKIMIHTDIEKDGDVNFLSPSAEEQSSFITSIMATACAGLSCGWSAKEAVPLRRKGFVDRMTPNLLPTGTAKDDDEKKSVAAFLDDLGLLLEQGSLTMDEALKWAELPVVPTRYSFTPKAVPPIFHDWETRLAIAGAPESVAQEFHRRAASGWYNPTTIVDFARWLNAIGVPPITHSQAADDFRSLTKNFGATVWDVDAIGRDIALGNLTEDAGLDLLGLTTEVRGRGRTVFLATERINEAASALHIDEVVIKHLNDQLLNHNITEADVMDALADTFERRRQVAVGGAR